MRISDEIEKRYYFVLDPASEVMAVHRPREWQVPSYLDLLSSLFAIKAGHNSVGRVRITAFPEKFDWSLLKDVRLESASFQFVAPNAPDHGAMRNLRNALTESRAHQAGVRLHGHDLSTAPEGLVREGVELSEAASGSYALSGRHRSDNAPFRHKSNESLKIVHDEMPQPDQFSPVLVKWIKRFIRGE